MASMEDKLEKLSLGFETEIPEKVLKGVLQGGRGDLALEFYKEMIEKGITFGLRTYKMLLDCTAKTEEVDVVQSIIADDMIREDLELIRVLKNKEVCLNAKYFEILVKGLCRANRMEDALEIVDIMKKRNMDDDSNINGIVFSGCLRQNNVSKALEHLETRVSTLCNTYSRRNSFKRAATCLKRW
ncbi:hypothetical protein Bca4012_088356 [Brassica carinata]|uniref:(rape) hypothetical protein n=1 Tax=Brassica napus TaxID=3708 RepID=A0A816RA97_BRANA|nr:unnamed protein product [Brassica napus]